MFFFFWNFFEINFIDFFMWEISFMFSKNVFYYLISFLTETFLMKLNGKPKLNKLKLKLLNWTKVKLEIWYEFKPNSNGVICILP